MLAVLALHQALAITADIAACQSFGFSATAWEIYGSSLLNVVGSDESNQ